MTDIFTGKATRLVATQGDSNPIIRAMDGLTGDFAYQSFTLTYSLVNNSSVFSTRDYATGQGYGSPVDRNLPFHPDTPAIFSGQGAGIRQAMNEMRGIAGLTFSEVIEDSTGNAVGDIRFGNSGDVNGGFGEGLTAALAFLPAPSGQATRSPIASDVWFASDLAREESFSKGGFAYNTIIHEVGHALGLLHPEDDPRFPSVYDQVQYTLMSYNEGSRTDGFQLAYYPTTFMVLDVLALEWMYGASNKNQGDSVYTFTDQRIFETIVDSGGTDIIRYQGQNPIVLDLREGVDNGSLLGTANIAQFTNGSSERLSNLFLSYGTEIENAQGGSGNDQIIGNSLSNQLAGGLGSDFLRGLGGDDFLVLDGGNDILDGGDGFDQGLAPLNRAQATVTQINGGYRVQGSGIGIDDLFEIERIQFLDGTLALDLSGNAGLIAKTGAALFGVSSLNDAGLMGAGIRFVDTPGITREILIDEAILARFGSRPSNEALVETLWFNIVGSAIPESSKNFYLSELDRGVFTQQSLTSFAMEVDENLQNVNLDGLMSTGLFFT